MQRVESAAYFEIVDLYARYNWAADDGNGEAWESCFTPDIVFKIDGVIWRDGRDELAARRREPVEGRPRQHWNSNILLRREGDSIRGRAQCVAFDVVDGRTVVQAVETYDDEIIFQQGKWRFAAREIRLLFSNIDQELFPSGSGSGG